ncbi:hypothetical protein [Nocardia asteroides]|uniref:hypothetical protein n=1 Tax=Nocardia asteroides TaxID=1824 RepID=UPI001E30A6CF|nr:hypothetical protein [Nocardia asteroides]UGT59162.1 hypothetical protein LTT61_17885 [Nocardia asteroides]
MVTVDVRGVDGLTVLAPVGAPTVLDPVPGVGVLVLEVSGGHLTWDLFGDSVVPAAVLDDPAAAQDWLWALYGEAAAVAVADGVDGPLDAEPADPGQAEDARRLAYAHWAARWWPASTLDGIAALDPGLLDAEIAELTAACDALVDGADAVVAAAVEVTARAEDYALAAGDGVREGMVLRRGSTGWAWHRCPPGVVDASEQALTWESVRQGGSGVLRVDVVAAPRTVPVLVPAHLRPWVRVGELRAPLDAAADHWVTTLATPEVAEPELFVPGVGSAQPDSAADRVRVREFARARLSGAGSLLRAESAAAADDSDF